MKRRGYVCMPVIEICRNVLIIVLSCRNISLYFRSHTTRNNKSTYKKCQHREYIPNEIYLIMCENTAVNIIHPRWINFFLSPCIRPLVSGFPGFQCHLQEDSLFSRAVVSVLTWGSSCPSWHRPQGRECTSCLRSGGTHIPLSNNTLTFPAHSKR